MSALFGEKVIVVAGPTASGKSDFAVELAQKVDGEIISADSRQIYKGLDIGTGKITRGEMQGIPHYMLDAIDPGQDCSVAFYQKLALPILEDIRARGKTPIICGGTGQYIDALIYNADFPAVPPNETLREALESKTTEELFKELSTKDPRRAQDIDPHNKVRLVRALEIIHERGIVPEQSVGKLRYETEFYIMHPTREALKKRVEKRLEKRLGLGMIEEVKWLMEKGFSETQMKRFGLEYVTIGKYLEGKFGEVDPTSLKSSAGQRMKQELITKTLQYAKRQQTWNKKYLPFAKLISVAP